jgi:hypothetical protein
MVPALTADMHMAGQIMGSVGLAKDFERMRKDLNAWAGGPASSDGSNSWNSWDKHGPTAGSFRKELKDKSTLEYLITMGFDESVSKQYLQTMVSNKGSDQRVAIVLEHMGQHFDNWHDPVYNNVFARNSRYGDRM